MIEKYATLYIRDIKPFPKFCNWNSKSTSKLKPFNPFVFVKLVIKLIEQANKIDSLFLVYSRIEIFFIDWDECYEHYVIPMVAFECLGARLFVMKIGFWFFFNVSTSTNETKERDKEETTKEKRFP